MRCLGIVVVQVARKNLKWRFFPALAGPPGVFSMSKWLISHNFVFSVLRQGAGLRDRLCSEYSKAGFSTSAWLFRLKKNWSEAICDGHYYRKNKEKERKDSKVV